MRRLGLISSLDAVGRCFLSTMHLDFVSKIKDRYGWSPRDLSVLTFNFRITLNPFASYQFALHFMALHRMASHCIALFCFESNRIVSPHVASLRVALYHIASLRIAPCLSPSTCSLSFGLTLDVHSPFAQLGSSFARLSLAHLSIRFASHHFASSRFVSIVFRLPPLDRLQARLTPLDFHYSFARLSLPRFSIRSPFSSLFADHFASHRADHADRIASWSSHRFAFAFALQRLTSLPWLRIDSLRIRIASQIEVM